ncbi:DUF2165 family protein [Campylobacter sp. IFREMER_LSEM_CL1846]|uniref:DUF2165 family protein n=1 Tax=Campylobacter sp. IFREMER_LSEM_CL1846 TaxID=2911614 RepID=UPI0021E640BD|nr:DUF2165 family protein [Campylobacter sp. IFREMER_LSEM_CL1846]HEC1747802.1 DUF2165 family protein [Campylobacter lari]MCV3433454.1 DUF2165 family protein [Campylobacter sp. IFREMER_LSEM_CL1846]HEC1755795.1 DUF2165 family protein [Campylobacter lari]HEC1768363.1 DUF2165 family protein [Campylobacter lari]HEC1788910.1 DUF2165 family protein [Campylobacter lari]
MNCNCSFSMMSVIRYSKMIILLTVASLAAIVVFGNITDYNSNFQFVKHVMSMDTKPDYLGNAIVYRAITNSTIHHIAYTFIICFEAFIMLTALKGALDMFKARNLDAKTFHEAKKFGIIALTCCCLLWFFGFQVVAAEWFGMWMSKTWNGLPDATRLVTYMLLALVYISIKNDD